MHRTPSQDDDQRYDPPASEPRPGQRGGASRRLQSPEANSYNHYPHIPKRRASLNAERQQETGRLSSRSAEREISQRGTPPAGARSSRRLTPGQEPPTQITAHMRVTQVTQATRRPPTRVAPSARPTPQRRPATSAPPPTFMDRLHDLSHHKVLLIACAVVLVIVVSLIPVMTGALSLHGSTQAGSHSSSSTGGSNSIPLNPHQLVITAVDTDHPPPPVLATAAYLMDMDTGATLYAYNPFMHLPMLSTTKLMTALLAVEHGNLDQQITITDALYQDVQRHISADSSLFGLKKGESYTLRDLLYGLLLPSGNDAAVVIADVIGGNYQHFVTMMNERALQLGMYDTHYMNPSGLLATGHYSSAHDLAMLGRYTMNNPVLHQVAGTHIYHIPKSAHHPERYLVNGNQFLWWYPGADGGKPGWDGATDFVQVVSCTRNHHHLIGVTMNTKDWWTDMRDLMNWGFDDFHWISPYDVDFQHPIPYDNEWDYFVRDKRTNTIPTADNGRYYIYTGYSISAPILSYFDKNGGLNSFGFPTSMPDFSQTPLVSQHFQKASIQCDLTSKQCKRL
jgi:D-alanyl-D-alanine carboxypeptidase